MSTMKLGEILIRDGVLTKRQLDIALKAQLLVGGHLGTNLIELGYVDENTLGRTLAIATGVPYAQPQLFDKISSRTLLTVHSDLAEEYQVIPLKLTEKTLQIAIVNPNNLGALDEVAFVSGRKLVPWIAPEVRIVAALERYYGVKRRSRYIALSLFLDDVRKTDWRTRRDIARSRHGLPPIAEIDTWQGPSDVRPHSESVAPQPEAPKPKPPAPRSSIMTLDALADRYGQAASGDDLAHAALEFGAARAKRIVLTLVRGLRASFWEESGFSIRSELRRDAGFEVTSESLVRLLMGNDHYCGPLPRGGELERFYTALKVESPEELLLIPIHVDDHLVAIALIDGGPSGHIQGDIAEFLKAFRLFGTGVSIVTMRKRLRDKVLVGAHTR